MIMELAKDIIFWGIIFIILFYYSDEDKRGQ